MLKIAKLRPAATYLLMIFHNTKDHVWVKPFLREKTVRHLRNDTNKGKVVSYPPRKQSLFPWRLFQPSGLVRNFFHFTTALLFME